MAAVAAPPPASLAGSSGTPSSPHSMAIFSVAHYFSRCYLQLILPANTRTNCSVPRPTSAASNSNSNANGKRSTSVTSKRGSEPPAPAAAAPKETKVGQNGGDNEVAIKVEEVKEDEGEGECMRYCSSDAA